MHSPCDMLRAPPQLLTYSDVPVEWCAGSTFRRGYSDFFSRLVQNRASCHWPGCCLVCELPQGTSWAICWPSSCCRGGAHCEHLIYVLHEGLRRTPWRFLLSLEAPRGLDPLYVPFWHVA